MNKILAKPKDKIKVDEIKRSVGGRGMRCLQSVNEQPDGTLEIVLTPDAPGLHLCEMIQDSGLVEWAKESND